MLRATLLADKGQVTEAIAAVKADVAADPTNKDRDAQFLLGLGNTAFKAGQASKKPEDYQRAIGLLQASDELNASANAKFLLAASAYQALAPTLADGKNWKCADVRSAETNLNLITTNMPGGGSVSPDFAKQVLASVPQLQQYVSAQSKRLCK